MVLIAVHGSASRSMPAERGTVHLSIEREHDDRAVVMRQVAELHERFREEAKAFVADGAATWWGSDQVWVRSERRYNGMEQQQGVFQIATARVHVRFQDFTALSAWILEAGSVVGADISDMEWTITRAHEDEAGRELRIEAVRDAIARAEAYASAIGGSGVELQTVWEAGLRPGADGSRNGRLVSFAGRRGGPELELRPADLELRAELTADFEVTSAQ